MQKILGMGVMLMLFIGVSVAQSGLSDEALAAMLANVASDEEAGIVVFVDDNGTTSQASYGVADIITGRSISLDDSFRIASVSKPIVAVAVLMLVDAGDIELDAPIADYLPADVLEGIDNGDTATVRQMLQMTSGIYSYTDSDAFDEASQDDPAYAWTALEVLDFVRGESADFEAGTAYYYSNTNYILAELLIESVAQMSLAEALEAWIFEPVGMTTCYVETPDRFAQGIVRGYMFDDDGDLMDITEINDGVGLGDGGVICTAPDLARFLPALVNGELLSQDALAEMLTTFDDGEGGLYGLGIGYDDTEFGMMLSHDGATSGFQSTMQYLPDEGLTVVVLTNNFDSEIVADVAFEAFALAFGE